MDDSELLIKCVKANPLPILKQALEGLRSDYQEGFEWIVVAISQPDTLIPEDVVRILLDAPRLLKILSPLTNEEYRSFVAWHTLPEEIKATAMQSIKDFFADHKIKNLRFHLYLLLALEAAHEIYVNFK